MGCSCREKLGRDGSFRGPWKAPSARISPPRWAVPCSEVAQAKPRLCVGTALAVNLHPRGHTCPIGARQGCSGTSTGLGDLCIPIPPPSRCQPAMLPGQGRTRGWLSPLPLNYFGFLLEFTALQDASITKKNGWKEEGHALSGN